MTAGVGPLRLVGDGVRADAVGRAEVPVGGRGGLNLTHSEPTERLSSALRVGGVAAKPAVARFDAVALRAWAESLGEPTFVGSRVGCSPRASEPHRCCGRGWHGWRRSALRSGPVTVGSAWRCGTMAGRGIGGGSGWRRVGGLPAAAVLAEGRSGRPKVGPRRGRQRCRLLVSVSLPSALRTAGSSRRGPRSSVDASPVRRSRTWLPARCGRSVRGEGVVTETGVEGGVFYAVRTIRDLIEMEGEVVVHLDLQPDLSAEQVAERLAHSRRPKDSGTTALRKAGLVPVGIGLLREATANELPSDPVDLAPLVKATPLRLVGAEAVERLRSPQPAVSASTRSMSGSCCVGCRASSSSARCWTGKRPRAAICCRPRSARRWPPRRGVDHLGHRNGG